MRTYTKYIIGEGKDGSILYWSGRDEPPSTDIADAFDYGFERANQILSESRDNRLILLKVKVTETHDVIERWRP